MHATGVRRWWLAAPAVCGLALLAAACATPSGNFSVLGYTTAPNYDPNIRTVRVPIFKNRTFRQNLEFDLTREVCHTIARDTPRRVVNGCEKPAETELRGTIISLTKTNILASPVNELRVGEVTLAVEVTWRDLRTGEVLSRPSRRPGEPPRPEGPGLPPIIDPINSPNARALPPVTGTPTAPSSPEVPVLPAPTPGADGTVKERVVLPDGTVKFEDVPPVVVRTTTRFIPELGQSITTAEQEVYQKTARQITHLMEKSW